MDSPSTGIWRITEKGRQWVQENRGALSRDWSIPSESSQMQEISETNLDIARVTKEEPEVDSMLETFGDFFVPLMRVLDSLPNRAGQSGEVLLIFERTYRDQIAPGQYTRNQSGNIRWEHNVRWSREKIKSLGFLDAPQHGYWRLTEKGHQWLVDHPKATHISLEKIKSRQMILSTPSKTSEKQMNSAKEFFFVLQEALKDPLRTIPGSIQYEFIQRSNYLQIRMSGYGGCHYEIILRREKHEIALHFESSAERSQARLQGFEPHIDSLSQSLGIPVYAGDFQARGWAQVRIETRARPLFHSTVKEYAELVARFVAATLPILRNIFAGEKTSHISPGMIKVAARNPMHAILDQEVVSIRAYLEGRSSLQISDEKICDWINFCYIFGMYSEGRELFSLVDGTEVNPWYYDRTKKLARLCEMKSR